MRKRLHDILLPIWWIISRGGTAESVKRPFWPVVTLRGAPQNNHVVTLRGTYVIAINVTGRGFQ